MIELSDAGYKLTIPYAKFQSDALRIFNYIKSKGLTGQLAGKRILIIKASGTAEAICHHWSFGGLNSDFNLKIDEIHKRLAGKLKFKSDADNDLPDDFRETILGWSEINPEGLNPEGVSANVRVYAGNEHSSRFMNGQYFHKFHTNEFIFAVEGADINAAYSGYEEIQVKVHPASGLGESSYFIYEAE